MNIIGIDLGGTNVKIGILQNSELTAENETFTKPEWLGKEVTGDIRYYNSLLSQTPYRNWGI